MSSWLGILYFHTIETGRSPLCFSPDLFKRCIAGLHKKGFQTISLLKAVECIKQDSSFPDRSLVITFDDGYESIYEEAFPVLKQYGMTATIFLTVGENDKIMHKIPSFDRRLMLHIDQIREMQRNNIQLGAHTLTHPDLTKITLKRAENEIIKSKAIIENIINSPVHSFAYPYGLFNNEIRSIVKKNFLCACAMDFGLITTKSDIHALERIDSAYFRKSGLFMILMNRFLPLYIMMRRIAFKLNK